MRKPMFQVKDMQCDTCGRVTEHSREKDFIFDPPDHQAWICDVPHETNFDEIYAIRPPPLCERMHRWNVCSYTNTHYDTSCLSCRRNWGMLSDTELKKRGWFDQIKKHLRMDIW